MQITDEHKINTYYQALLNREADHVGIFYAGVKTTSVFCIATCRARKPKKENVTFYSTFKDALDHGFRPCKICRPTENAHESPPFVEMGIQMVRDRPKQKVTDQDLREAGISPIAIRRWFNDQYGMTFQTFQRMYRINEAYRELKEGKNATTTAFSSGFDSLSGFGYTYKKLLGNSPMKSRGQNVVLLSRTTTPLGPMFIGATDQGVCLLEFVDRRMLETEFRDIQRLLKARIILGENEHIQQTKIELEEYFAGQRKTFAVALDTPGTDFQRAAWNALHAISFGTTATYQDQARALGNPAGVRAVAAANGNNRVSIIIPCHRVIGKNGKLTGYGGGLERKAWLLRHEQMHSDRVGELF